MQVKQNKCAVLRVWLLVGLALSSPAAISQSYPTKVIRIIDGFTSGSATDFQARVIAQKLTERLGQSVIVENRPGGGGNVGPEIAAKSPPDGYTLLMGSILTLAASRNMYPNLGYDALRDLAPVTTVSSGAYVLVVATALPVTTVKELIALAKSRPGQLRYGSGGGVGSPAHLATEMLKARAGIDILHVPYKGATPAVTAVVSGEVQLSFPSLAAALPLVEARKLRAVAVTTTKRVPAVPDLPTVAESGVLGFDVTPWYGVLAPTATPREIIGLLSAEIDKVLQLADVRMIFAKQGLETTSGTPEHLRQVLQTETERWGKVIKEANIKAE